MAENCRFILRRLGRFACGIGLLVVAGCGYQRAGESSFLPKDIRTIYLEPFINRSRDVGLEKELASGLRSEIYRRQQWRVVDQGEQGGGILNRGSACCG